MMPAYIKEKHIFHVYICLMVILSDIDTSPNEMSLDIVLANGLDIVLQFLKQCATSGD